jgi:tetratricopeptide (TPR) repeat protein
MARAAAKRNRGTSKAAQPVAADQAKSRRKAEKSLEDQLFFNRLRGHAKWVFVLLAVVFGASFVFLGVGSGNAGLGDVFSNVFGGGSAPSIESLQEKVSESPRDVTAVTNLAQALERDGRIEEAIATYRTFLQANPKNQEILGNLAVLHQNQAAAAYADIQTALRAAGLAAPAAQFRPGSGLLGQALGSQVDPLGQTASAQAEAAYQEAVSRYQAANKDALGVYRQLSKLEPNEPTALLRYAQAAEAAGELKTAVAVYSQFLERFPDDALAADAKKKIAQLKQQQKQQASGLDLSELQGQNR